MRRIVVMGGTGFLGRSVCEQLARRWPGVTIAVPTRRLRFGNDLQTLPGVELVPADVHDTRQLTRCLQGADAVVQLVAILHGSAEQFERTHVTLLRTLSAACATAAVTRVVHVSALGVDAGAGGSVGGGVGGGVGGQPPSNYLRSKAAGEAVLRAAGLNLSVLRPSVIFGARDRFMNLFAQLQVAAPVVPLAGADAHFQPVWVDDVAQAIVMCLADDGTIGQTYECAGPSVYTLADLVRLAGRLSGHERAVVPLPGWAGRLQARVMEALPGEPLMSRDNVDSMLVPNVASGKLPGLQALGIEPASLEAIAPSYLAPGQGLARMERWRAAR